MSAEIRGRLFGRNVLEATFRAAPDEDLFLGELLVGVDEGTGRRYLFRVVDVTYGSEHREPGWAERVAGTLLADDERGEAGAHPLHEQARRTYRVATCSCLGYLAGTEFRKPKSLPTQFSRVVTPACRRAFLGPFYRDIGATGARGSRFNTTQTTGGAVSRLNPTFRDGRVWPPRRK